MTKRVIYNHRNVNIAEYTGWRKSYFRNYISFRWWNKKLITLTSVGVIYHRTITRFIFKSHSKKCNSNLINSLMFGSWASQFKFMHSPTAPPREHDHNLALNIDTYLTYVDKQIIRRS